MNFQTYMSITAVPYLFRFHMISVAICFPVNSGTTDFKIPACIRI